VTPLNVLFLCTGNSARSIIAESILRKDGDGRFRAFSAGSMPKGAVHPLAFKVLASYGYPVDGLSSKTWQVFAGPDAPRMDFVLTVCDNAAGEACPLWPGQPVTAHWGIEDPAAVDGDGQREAFLTAFWRLGERIVQLLALPVESMDPATLKQRLSEIGRSETSLA
jgi:protein-tyrosine-phosphatase